MKTGLISAIILISLILAGCSLSPKWDLDVSKKPAFLKDKASQIEITVTENDKPVTGLEVTAQLSMVKMDHGTIDIKMEELEDGLYAAKAPITMDGKWEAMFFLEKDEQELEKVIEMDIEKANGVASINGEWITGEDVEFYRFINQLHIEMARETDQQKYTGDELDEAMTYWEGQEKLNENENMLISQIIRLRAMAMLGEEKGYDATETEINREIDKVRSQYSKSAAAVSLITEFGEDKFWDYEQSQYQKIVLTQKVQADLIEKVKAENPKAGEQEVQFDAEKDYEELLVSQVGSLKIEIL